MRVARSLSPRRPRWPPSYAGSRLAPVAHAAGTAMSSGVVAKCTAAPGCGTKETTKSTRNASDRGIYQTIRLGRIEDELRLAHTRLRRARSAVDKRLSHVESLERTREAAPAAVPLGPIHPFRNLTDCRNRAFERVDNIRGAFAAGETMARSRRHRRRGCESVLALR